MRELIVICLIVLLSHNVSAMEIKCPDDIEIEEKAALVPDKWLEVGSLKRKHKFVSILFGEYSDVNGTMEDDDLESKNSSKAIWTFNDKKIHAAFCLYENTSINLMQKLPQATKKCEVSFDINQKGTWILKKAECF